MFIITKIICEILQKTYFNFMFHIRNTGKCRVHYFSFLQYDQHIVLYTSTSTHNTSIIYWFESENVTLRGENAH